MSIMSSLFGGEKAVSETAKTVNNVFDGVRDGIDAAFYTSEEKAQHQMKLTELRLETLKTVSANFTPGDALTRRVLAWFITGFYFGNLLLCEILTLFQATEVADTLLTITTISPPEYVTNILLVYFGYYGIKQGIAKWKS